MGGHNVQFRVVSMTGQKTWPKKPTEFVPVYSLLGPSSDRCEDPIEIEGIILIRARAATAESEGIILILLILISHFERIFEGLDISKSCKIWHTHHKCGTLQPYVSLCLRCGKGAREHPIQMKENCLVSPIWLKFGRHMYHVQTNKSHAVMS